MRYEPPQPPQIVIPQPAQWDIAPIDEDGQESSADGASDVSQESDRAGGALKDVDEDEDEDEDEETEEEESDYVEGQPDEEVHADDDDDDACWDIAPIDEDGQDGGGKPETGDGNGEDAAGAKEPIRRSPRIDIRRRSLLERRGSALEIQVIPEDAHASKGEAAAQRGHSQHSLVEGHREPSFGRTHSARRKSVTPKAQKVYDFTSASPGGAQRKPGQKQGLKRRPFLTQQSRGINRSSLASQSSEDPGRLRMPFTVPASALGLATSTARLGGRRAFVPVVLPSASIPT